MSHAGYIAASWGVVLGVVALYGLRLLQRGRALARLVPQPRRRWSTSDDDAAR